MEQNATQSTTTAAEDSVGFWRIVTSGMPRHEIASKIRLTKSGVFIHEQLVDVVARAYQQWLSIVTGNERDTSLEKASRKLFESDAPQLVYVLDGKLCLPGYIVVKQFSEQPSAIREIGISLTLAEPLDTVSYIHPRDPFLEQLRECRAEMRVHDGLVFSFKEKEKTFSINERCLAEFAAVSRTSTLFPKKYPAITGALRECILPFRELFIASRPVSKRRKMLVPEQFVAKDFGFRRIYSLIFAIKNNVVVGIFELHGKNLFLLTKNEIRKLQNNTPHYNYNDNKQNRHTKPNSGASYFEAPPEKSRYFGKISARSLNLLITSGAFFEFMRHLPLVPVFRNQVPGNFTAKDCLNQLHAELKSSEPLDHQTAEAILKQPTKRGAHYRITDLWIFVTEEKNVLAGCIYRRSIKKTTHQSKQPR